MKATFFSILMLCSFVVQGQLEWVYQTGGNNTSSYEEDRAKSITNDIEGNTYITGLFDGNSDFDFGAQTYILSTSGYTNTFVVKLNPSGELIWAKFFEGDPNGGNSIKVDELNNVLIGGFFQGTVDFNTNSGVQLETSHGNYDGYVVKLDSNGDFIWVKTFGGTMFDSCNDIVVDDVSNIYVTGSFSSTSVDFDPGSGVNISNSSGFSDIFLVKLDQYGSWKWSNTYGGQGSDHGVSIAISNSSKIYLSGEFSNSVDFDLGPLSATLTSYSDLDGFILKVDTLGQYLWSKSFECTSSIYIHGLAIDQNENCYLTGDYQEIMDADPSGNAVLLTSNGGWDVFLVALDFNGNFLWANSYGSSDGSDKSNGICTDLNNNIYVTGFIGPMVDFDLGLGTNYINDTDNNAMFVLKLDQNGFFQWGEVFSSTIGISSGMDITCDISNQIYVGGSFGGSLDINVGNNSNQLDCIGSQDAFVFKLGNLTNLKEETIICSLFPNPCTDYLEIVNPYSVDIEMFLMNGFGEILEIFTTSPGSNLIDLANYPSGIYFVKSVEKSSALKLVKL